MSRRRRPAIHPNHERWLVSYADFITLLFAFFVVMFASSQVDKRKVGQLALAIQVAFQKLGMFTPSAGSPSLIKTETPISNKQIIDNQVKPENLGLIVPSSSNELGRDGSVQHPEKVREELQDALADQIRKQQVSVRSTREGLVISLREVAFYNSGSATLMPSAFPTLVKITRILLPRHEFIRIEGHTDDVPIHNSVFRSNWELSMARASGMVDTLITQFGFAPQRLSAAGYAEFHPVTSNDTAEGRAQNRRVDIVVLNPALWGFAGSGVTPSSRPASGMGAADTRSQP